MSNEHSLADYGAKIDRRLEIVLEPANGARMPVIRETTEECDNRWCGELLVRSSASVTDSTALLKSFSVDIRDGVSPARL